MTHNVSLDSTIAIHLLFVHMDDDQPEFSHSIDNG